MSGGMTSAASTSPSRTLRIASARECTLTVLIDSKRGFDSLETLTRCPPRSIVLADGGTSLRIATRGLLGPLVTAKPTSAAMRIG